MDSAHTITGPAIIAGGDDLADAGRALMPADARECLAWWDGDAVRLLRLERVWTRIGRSIAADVQLEDATVSRRHALLVRQHDGVRVLDDGSLHGVWVNGQRTEHQVLRDGDVIQVGYREVVFLVGEDGPSFT